MPVYERVKMFKLAVVDIFNEPQYTLPIIKELGPNSVIFYYSQIGEETYRPIIQDIQLAGIEIIKDDLNYSKARQHRIFYADASKVAHARRASQLPGQLMRPGRVLPATAASMELLPYLKKNGARCICYFHSVDDVPRLHSIYPDDFFIAPCESLFYKGLGTGTFVRGPNGRPLAGRTEAGWEIAYAGPLNIGEEAIKAKAVPKEILQDQLAENLAVNLNKQLPVLSYFLHARSDTFVLAKGLTRLAEYFNIIFKTANRPIPEIDLRGIEGYPSIFFNYNYKLNNIQRVAADLVLSDLNSSGAITSLFLGLRYILCHTERYLVPPNYDDVLANYTRLLSDPMDIKVRLACCLRPISLQATEMIIERFHDQQYWAQYDAELPRLKQVVLGDHRVGKPALRKAAELIRQVLTKGSFWPEMDTGAELEVVKWPGRPYNPPIDLNL